MMTDRRTLSIISVVLLLVTSGCLGMLGDDAFTFKSAPASVSEETTANTGYQKDRVQNLTQNYTIPINNNTTREFTITNWVVRYNKQVSVGSLGDIQGSWFVTFSTPQVKMFGQSLNPMGGMKHEELVSKFASKSGQLENITFVNSRNVTVLGNTSEVSKYRADMSHGDGKVLDMYILFTMTAHEGDYVGAIAIYPRVIDEQEQPNVFKMMRNLEHDGDGED